jgi:hypothetical protein
MFLSNFDSSTSGIKAQSAVRLALALFRFNFDLATLLLIGENASEEFSFS